MKRRCIGYPAFRLTAIAAAVCAAAGGAQAQSEATLQAREDLARPNSHVDAGVGYLFDDSRRRGQYSGIRDAGAYGLLNLGVVRRDDATGTWLKLTGRNLGLDSRELRFEHERQGNWGYFLEFGQLPRYEPLVVTTGLTGVGSAAQTVSGTPARELNLKMDHDTYTFGIKKFLAAGLEVKASYRQDEKNGARMFGRGTPSVMEFLAEPIDRTTRLWDLTVSYTGAKLQLTGGYAGSTFDNHAPRLDVAGGNAGFTGGATPMTMFALPPSNEAHQLHVSGGYNFTDTTRGTFRLSRTKATQDEPFLAVSAPAAALATRASLDGRVDTTLAYASLSSTPLAGLDLTANLRFEDRDDKTPVSQYITATAPTTTLAGTSGRNVPRSSTQWKGLFEAGYRLPDGYRLIGGLDYDRMKRNVPEPFRRIGYRETTDETQARVELKRLVSETLTGSLAYMHADRGGSDYVPDTFATVGAAANNQTNSLLWADRRRDKWRLLLDWVPTEELSLQFVVDDARDQYTGKPHGPREGHGGFYSVEAHYTLSERWSATGWISREDNQAEQSTRTSAAPTVPSLQPWQARLRYLSDAAGAGLRGKLNARTDVGGDLLFSYERARHHLQPLAAGVGGNVIASLPDYFYRLASLKLFGKYSLDRQSALRVDFIYDRWHTDDWTWQGWVYTDGTTVSQPLRQSYQFLGVSWHYDWR